MSLQNPPRGFRKSCKVRQACDSCHSRKIRCDGGKPCVKCQETTEECTYLAVHRKTGPKGARRLPSPAVLPLQTPTPSGAHLSCTGSPGSHRNAQPTVQTNITRTPEPQVAGDGAFQTSRLVSADVIKWCLDAFFEYKYPLTPILQRDQVYDSLYDLANSPGNYGLMAACCAVISLSPEILPPPPSSSVSSDLTLPSVDFLISEALRSRRHCNLIEAQSLTHIQTSFFLFSAYFCMGKDDAAWFYLRESMTILQTLRLHEEATYYQLGDCVSAAYARRMFWVLFITERAYALQRHRPLTLQSTLAVPSVDAMGPDVEVLTGFLDLISLFQHFDVDFIASWNSASLALSNSSSESEPLLRLQDVLQYALPSVSDHSEMQQADFLISRQWLKVIVWKLCVSKTLLSNTGGEDSMSLQYPIAVTRDVVLISRLLPARAFEANGVGILEKIFDMGCSLADLLSVTPTTRQGSAMVIGPIDTLMEMVRIVGTTLGGNYRHLGVLTEKANQCLLMNVDRGLPLRVEQPPDESEIGQIWSLDDEADLQEFLSW